MVLDTYLLMLLGAYVCKINGHIVEFASRDNDVKETPSKFNVSGRSYKPSKARLWSIKEFSLMQIVLYIYKMLGRNSKLASS